MLQSGKLLRQGVGAVTNSQGLAWFTAPVLIKNHEDVRWIWMDLDGF